MASSSRLDRAARMWVAVAGILLGTAYAAAPLMVWFIIVAAGLVAAIAYGLPERERRWVLGILILAILLRVLAVALLSWRATPDHVVSFPWDGDGVFLKLRGLWIRNVWLGLPIAPVDFSNAFSREYGWTTYINVLAYLQYLVGPAPYSIHLLNIAIYVASAGILYRMVRQAFGAVPALVGLGLMLFLPSLFLWSVSALKESLYVFLLVCSLASAVAIIRSKSWVVKAAALCLLVAAAEANGTVRAGARLICVAGLVAGLAGSLIVRRPRLLLPSLVVLPLIGYLAMHRPAVRAAVMTQLKTSAVLHIGNVRTEGHSYRLLDQRFYSEDSQSDVIATMEPAEAARFAIRAVASFVLVPFPWQAQSTSEILFVPLQVTWYVLVLLAIAGCAVGIRRDALVTCVLVGPAVAATVAIALNSGNIGTMVRHRDTIVPLVVWLSASGGVAVFSWLVSLGVVPPDRQPDLQARALCR
jgi:hypothetical protein